MDVVIMHKIVRSFCLGFFIVTGTVFLQVRTSQASNLDVQERALDKIADFADKFCKTIPMEGKNGQLELSGEIKVEVSRLIKLFADLEIEGAAKYLKENYQGVLQKDLIEAINSNVDCRLKVWKDLQEKLLPSNKPKKHGNENIEHLGDSQPRPIILKHLTSKTLEYADVNISVVFKTVLDKRFAKLTIMPFGGQPVSLPVYNSGQHIEFESKGSTHIATVLVVDFESKSIEVSIFKKG